MFAITKIYSDLCSAKKDYKYDRIKHVISR